MSYLDRLVVDGSDRDAWALARRPGLGASDAATFSKRESVDKYVAAKLGDRSFTGNSYTASGHRWEPLMLAYVGIPGNVALFHSPDEKGFVATPDGIDPTGRFRLAECKAKHNKVVDGPDLKEWRQLAWQFLVFPEAAETEFVWVELNRDNEIRDGRNGQPSSMTVPRDHPKILDLTERILPIAREVLPRLRAALEIEKELAA